MSKAGQRMISDKIPRSQNSVDYQRLPRKIGAMPKRFRAGQHIPPHSHERAQLLYAISGVMTLSTAASTWMIPPNRAVFISPDTRHEIWMSGEVDMRTLYIDARNDRQLPPACKAIYVSDLLRELIVRAMELPVLSAENGAPGRIMRLILDELADAPELPMAVPMPREAFSRKVCELVMRDPDISRTLADYGKQLGLSECSLARRFQAETGLSFGEWRRQYCLLEAIKRISLGVPVTTVAIDLRYGSTSAFSAMFRKVLGSSPRDFKP